MQPGLWRSPMSIPNAPGPLTVSSINPRYFAVDSTEALTGKVIYLTGSYCNNNFHDGLGVGQGMPERARAIQLRRLPRFPHRTGSQLHPAVALGAVPGLPVSGRRPLLHDTATVAADGTRLSQGRQAQI